jgi:formate dehydrogenase maturation protein FdhE
MITPEQEKEYLEGGGGRCPFCGSPNIVGDHIEVDGSTAWQEVSCNACEKRWHDVYNLVGAQEIE